MLFKVIDRKLNRKKSKKKKKQEKQQKTLTLSGDTKITSRKYGIIFTC